MAGLTALAIGAAASPAAVATPEEDCQAVRDRDHQIWLDLIANLPPGAPIPPEPINPCIPAGSETTTTAPVPLPGQGGQTGTGGWGPQVGANAPTLMPRYKGTDIVPVPGIPAPPSPDGGQPARVEGGRVTVPTTDALSPTATPAPTAEQTASPTPAPPGPATQPGQTSVPPVTQESTLPAEPAGGEGPEALLLLTGLAGAVAGATRFGRGSNAGGRWPWSGQSTTMTIRKPFGGEQTFILMADGNSPRTYLFPQPVPDGGRMRPNADGSVDILDSNGDVVGTIKAPWAYDATGRAVHTWYEVDGDTLVQHIDPGAGTVYPILADPEYNEEQRAKDEATVAFVGPGTLEFEEERRAARERLAANPKPVPVTPETWEQAVTTEDLSVPDPGESGDPMLEGLTEIDESRSDSGTSGVPFTPDMWEQAVTTEEFSVPDPGESGDPMLEGLTEIDKSRNAHSDSVPLSGRSPNEVDVLPGTPIPATAGASTGSPTGTSRIIPGQNVQQGVYDPDLRSTLGQRWGRPIEIDPSIPGATGPYSGNLITPDPLTNRSGIGLPALNAGQVVPNGATTNKAAALNIDVVKGARLRIVEATPVSLSTTDYGGQPELVVNYQYSYQVQYTYTALNNAIVYSTDWADISQSEVLALQGIGVTVPKVV